MSPDKRRRMTGFQAMGVEVTVEGATSKALMDIADLFGEWERTFTRFAPDSELSQVNANPDSTVVVSETFARVTRVTLAAWKATGGLVDPTLACAIESAGYDCDLDLLRRDDPRPPGAPSPGRAAEVRIAGRLLQRPPGVRLDLAGVVKAIVVDQSLRMLPDEGFVAAGGDVATRGPATVGLPGGGSITLLHGGLATSGIKARSWQRGGGLQHHLIDPRTGRPAHSRWHIVTVAAASCLGADVAAKAAFLLSDEGPEWLDERNLPGRFFAEDDVVENDAWREQVGEPAAAR
jgi:thiamine biosynthesis lipoprotein